MPFLSLVKTLHALPSPLAEPEPPTNGSCLRLPLVLRYLFSPTDAFLSIPLSFSTLTALLTHANAARASHPPQTPLVNLVLLPNSVQGICQRSPRGGLSGGSSGGGSGSGHLALVPPCSTALRLDFIHSASAAKVFGAATLSLAGAGGSVPQTHTRRRSMVVHKDEALWLSAEQQADWVLFKKQVGASVAAMAPRLVKCCVHRNMCNRPWCLCALPPATAAAAACSLPLLAATAATPPLFSPPDRCPRSGSAPSWPSMAWPGSRCASSTASGPSSTPRTKCWSRPRELAVGGGRHGGGMGRAFGRAWREALGQGSSRLRQAGGYSSSTGASHL